MDSKDLKHLSATDLQTQVWERWKGDLTARLQKLREENDNELDEKTTARVRGRIAEIKSMLALGKPNPAMSGASDN